MVLVNLKKCQKLNKLIILFNNMINYIIPFGSDCYAAITIETLKLRIRSLPFDYIYSDINMLKDCLENNFINFHSINNDFYFKNF